MRILALAAAVVLGGSCDGQRTPAGPSSSGVLVSGHVLDFVTNAVVPSATVVFGDVTTVTDSAGWYTLSVAAPGRFEPVIDGRSVGVSRVTGSTYRGDFFVRSGTCVARYGTVADARTLRPVAGAAVSVSGTYNGITGLDGWYRINLGCPALGVVGYNTTFIYVTHSNYVDYREVAGRGVGGVWRVDFELQRR